MDQKRPSWYTDEHDSNWDRVRAAFRNDWEQTRHDFGSDKARDLDQDVDNTVKQAAGTEDPFEKHEAAFRYGHAARRHYGSKFPTWNDDLDKQLRTDYPGTWDRDRADIQRAYEYRYQNTTTGSTAENKMRPDNR